MCLPLCVALGVSISGALLCTFCFVKGLNRLQVLLPLAHLITCVCVCVCLRLLVSRCTLYERV